MDVAVGAEQGKTRRRGEESYLADQLSSQIAFLGVADGFGTLAKGVPAAPLALTLCRDYLRRKARLGSLSGRTAAPQMLSQIAVAALGYANNCIFSRSGSNDDFVAGGISTATVLIVGHHAFISHVGDARVYLLRRQRLEALTLDDAVAMERVPSAPGGNAPQPKMRSLLWRTLGTQPKLEASVAHLELLPGDRLMLCTSGVHRNLVQEEIADALDRQETAADALATLMVTSRVRSADDGGAAIVTFDPVVPLREGAHASPRLETPRTSLLVLGAILCMIALLFVLRGFHIAP